MASLKGQTVLLTGASRGIGHELACALAKEGAKLIIVAHPWHEQDLKQCEKECKDCKECAGCEGSVLDLSDPQAVQKCADECAKKGVTILINNAGIFGGHKSEDQGPLKGNPDDWDKTMRVNALAPMRLVRALAPKMVEKGEGYIINITDVEAYHTGPHHPAYAASKYALRGFTHSCYEQLRGHGVKVVEIAPGATAHTGMPKRLPRMAEKSDMHAGQGFIEPKDVVEAVMFVFRLSKNAVPEEIIIKAAKPST